MDKSALETAALQLKSLLLIISSVESDNIPACEMALALTPAAELAEKLYCGIINMKEV